MTLKSEKTQTLSRLFPGILSMVAFLILSGCASTKTEVPTSMAIRRGTVSNLNNVKVRVSISNRAVYVYEGDELRLATAVEVGKPGHETPVGNFKAFNKIAKKRSNTFGFFVKGDQIIPGKHSKIPSGYRYVGYPMPYWVQFTDRGHGFHAGAVWPDPKTHGSHGCLHIHKSVAGDFFRMVNSGTSIHIANNLPEDATLGKNVPRPTDYDHPDSPGTVKITDAPFSCAPNVFF